MIRLQLFAHWRRSGAVTAAGGQGGGRDVWWLELECLKGEKRSVCAGTLGDEIALR